MEQKKLRLTKPDIVAVVALLLLIVCVRLFETKLFYDPLLAYFKRDDGRALPEYSSSKLFFGLAFRYWLNSVFSLGVIWFIFKDKTILKLTALLYGLLFVVLIAAVFVILQSAVPNVLWLFYTRRFLIQPLFIILFVPAFYYQKIMR